MRIVLGNNALDGPGGTETYTLTVAEHLQRLGHEVWIYANEQGLLADRARADGLRVPERAADLPPEIDAVVASDGITALGLTARYPAAPVVLIGHSDLFDLSLPPQLYGGLAGVVALYDRVERRMRGVDLAVPITRLAQPVDTEVFRSLRPLRAEAPQVLVYGNYVRGERIAMIERACAAAGLACTQVGVHAARERTLSPAETLNDADIVIGKARVIIEAMATGRAAYALDHNGGDGWVTAASYAQQAADNFGGQATDLVIDEARLAADLAAYTPSMGLVNRDLAIRHHTAVQHAAELAELLVGLAPGRERTPAPTDEMARLVRTAWQHERRAFGLGAHAERLEVRVHELESAQAEAVRRADAAEGTAKVEAAARRATEARVVDAEARAAQAEAAALAARAERATWSDRALTAEADSVRHGDALGAFQQTRRYRLAQRLARPLDRLRARHGDRS